MNDILSQLVTNVTALLADVGLTATVRPCRVEPQGQTHEVHISVVSAVPADKSASAGGDTGYVELGITAFAPYPQRTVDELVAAEAWLNAFDQALLDGARLWRTGWLLCQLMPINRPPSPPELRGWRLSASRVRIYV